MNRTTTTLAVALIAAALTACGSNTDDKAAPSPTNTTATETPAPAPSADTSTADLEHAVQAYTTAYFAADVDTAYSALSARCAKEITKAVYEAVVKKAAADYGPDHPATGITAQVSGDLARVTYKVQGLPKFNQNGQPWAREGGAWHYDAC